MILLCSYETRLPVISLSSALTTYRKFTSSTNATQLDEKLYLRAYKSIPSPSRITSRSILLLASFSNQLVFHMRLRDSKFPLVFRTLLSVLTVLNNTVVWTVSVRPLISKSSSLFTKPLGIVPSAPTTIGITVTFMFQSFFVCSLERSKYLSIFSLLCFLLLSTGTAKSTLRQILFFLLTNIKSCILVRIK